MILDSTYKNKDHKQLLLDVVGEPFTFLDSLKMNILKPDQNLTMFSSSSALKLSPLVSDVFEA